MRGRGPEKVRKQEKGLTLAPERNDNERERMWRRRRGQQSHGYEIWTGDNTVDIKAQGRRTEVRSVETGLREGKRTPAGTGE